MPIKMVKLVMILVSCYFSVYSAHDIEESPLPTDTHYSMNINMPDVTPTVPDSYICTAKKLTPQESYIVQYEPDADSRRVHHMLLFGCMNLHYESQVYPGHWECSHGDICKRTTIIYGWAKNAPAMNLPKDVGFLTGGNSSIQYLVLQVHYAEPITEGDKDNSGLKLHMTFQRQKYIAGIRLLFGDNAEIPPRKPIYHIDINCKYDEIFPIYAFAYRVHTHKLGVVVSGYKYNTLNNTWTFLAKGNPQWPQAFYPLRVNTITNNDILAARCTYNSSEMGYPVKIGSQSSDEMCNFYLMYYTDYRNGLSMQSTPCFGTQFPHLIRELPLDSDTPLPRIPALEQQAFGGSHNSHSFANSNNLLPPDILPDGKGPYKQLPKSKEVYAEDVNNEYRFKVEPGWPNVNIKFGQISAVTIDNNGNIVVLHRADHVWNERTFDILNNYLLIDEGPILQPPVICLDAVTGLIHKEWGEKLFYMPHGLFVTAEGDYWVTDVALHQVFKFVPSDLEHPSMTLGERFKNGNDRNHFCKPASVAVSKDGEIYVADGYCNTRIVKFTPDGKFLSQLGKQDSPFDRNPPVGAFKIPHKVVLLEDRDLVCVADRENGRIQCFSMNTGRFRFLIQREEFHGVVYSIDYAADKGLIFAISGENYQKGKLVKAFVFNVTDQKLLSIFAPPSGTFSRPHDLAVLHNAEEVYVTEIGPNRIWKFVRRYHKSTKKVLNDFEHQLGKNPTSPPGAAQILPLHVENPHSRAIGTGDEELTSFETSLIIMSLLAIPVLCMVLFTVIIRLKRRGKLQHCSFGHLKGWLGGYRTPHPQDKFNIGNLLNPHKGFDPVSVEESDADGDEGSESDNEEFNTIAKKT